MTSNSNRPLNLLESESTRRHHQQTFWQIIFPISITGLIIIVLAIFNARTTISQISLNAQIALIWMLIPAMLFTLVGLAVTIVFIIFSIKLINILPGYADLLQLNVTKIANCTKKFADWCVEPILRIHSFLAILSKLTRKRQPKSILRQLYSGGKYELK